MSDIHPAAQRLAGRFGWNVLTTWLAEYGYQTFADAWADRASRIERELDAHGKRLADRAQMSRAPVGRAGVIR